MNFTHTVLYLTIYSLYLFLPSNVPGQGLLDSIAQFITGPFGKAITLIAIVLCGVSYMYGKQSDNSPSANSILAASISKTSSVSARSPNQWPIFLRKQSWTGKTSS